MSNSLSHFGSGSIAVVVLTEGVVEDCVVGIGGAVVVDASLGVVPMGPGGGSFKQL